MAIKINNTISRYSCPNCKTVVRTNNDAWFLIYVLLFIPVGLIALIVKLISRKTKIYTKAGEEIIICPNCGKKIALDYNGTRLIISPKEIMDFIMPDIRIIQSKKIVCNKYVSDDEFSETLSLQFINASNQKSCDVTLTFIIFDIRINIINGQKFYYKEQDFVKNIIDVLK